jgi:dipeptidyl aminopeptidase/acylaminoacyl peptidase
MRKPMFARLAASIAAVLMFTLAAVPATAAPPLEAYGKLPGIDMAALSLSGRYYAMVGEVAGERRLVVVEVGGKPVTVAPIGDHKVRDLVWAGDDHVLLFTSRSTGLGPRFKLLKYEVGELLVLNPKTKQSFWALTKGADGNGVWGYHGVRLIGGKWYAFLGGLKFNKALTGRAIFKDSHPDLFRVDLQSGDAKLIDEDDGGFSVRSWVVGAQGSVDAVLDYDQRSGEWAVRRPGQQPLASGVDQFGDTLLAGKGRQDGTVIYRERDADGEDSWIETRLDTGGKLVLFRGIHIADQFRDPWTDVWIGYRRDADRPDNRFFDEAIQDRVRAAQHAFPGMNVQLKSWDLLFGHLIVHTDGRGDAGTWWLADIATGRAEEIGRSYPLVRTADVAPVSVVNYTAADGMEMAGVLTLPPGREAKGLPLVVMPHDGPAERDYPQFDWFAQAFASRGYAVFQPNFRGSEGYGVAFRQAGYGQWGGKMQTDISDGVAELARQGIVDPGRACIVGQAYGGYAALAGVTLQKGLYRCAVGVAAITDLDRMRNFLANKYGRVGPALHDFDAEVGRELEAISPARQAARADAPVLLIHGKDDTEVPIDQSRTMERALRAEGKPVAFVELPGEDHWLSREDTRLAMLKAAVGFVEQHNPPR